MQFTYVEDGMPEVHAMVMGAWTNGDRRGVVLSTWNGERWHWMSVYSLQPPDFYVYA